MKRIITTFFFIAVISGAMAQNSEMSVGLLGGNIQTVTGSLGDAELCVGYWGALYLSVDYKLLGAEFDIQGEDGFYWNGALGAYTTVSDNVLLGVRAPFEFGWKGLQAGEGMLDFYAEAAPNFRVFSTHNSGFFFVTAGLGFRYFFQN